MFVLLFLDSRIVKVADVPEAALIAARLRGFSDGFRF
jgi:hypothetical protein